VRHPARFVLVGSGNPEEGELRPQLLDRFGLSVEVKTPTDLATRIEVVRRRDAFERDPAAFTAQWRKEDLKLRKRIVAGARAPGQRAGARRRAGKAARCAWRWAPTACAAS
jgi:magnesium chelatase subunit I